MQVIAVGDQAGEEGASLASGERWQSAAIPGQGQSAEQVNLQRTYWTRGGQVLRIGLGVQRGASCEVAGPQTSRTCAGCAHQANSAPIAQVYTKTVGWASKMAVGAHCSGIQGDAGQEAGRAASLGGRLESVGQSDEGGLPVGRCHK